MIEINLNMYHAVALAAEGAKMQIDSPRFPTSFPQFL